MSPLLQPMSAIFPANTNKSVVFTAAVLHSQKKRKFADFDSAMLSISWRFPEWPSTCTPQSVWKFLFRNR